MSKKSRQQKESPLGPRRHRGGRGANSLELVYQLNARAFLLLRQPANRHLPLSSMLDEATLRRAAHFPFLIVDVYFLDEG